MTSSARRERMRGVYGMAEKHKVRTTMRPHEEIEVSEAERIDLARQGLIVQRDKQGKREQGADK